MHMRLNYHKTVVYDIVGWTSNIQVAVIFKDLGHGKYVTDLPYEEYVLHIHCQNDRSPLASKYIRRYI